MPNGVKINIPIRECFAQPNSLTVITNPTQLLLDSDKLRMLTLCGVDTEGMSDFEKFSVFLKKLPEMRGSAVRELFYEEMEQLFGVSEELDNIDSCELWRFLCEKIEKEDIKKQCGKSAPEKVLPMISGASDYSELISENLDFVNSSDSDFVSLDISHIDFVRTDKYHADEAYKAYLRGDESGESEFVSGMLYPICEEIKKRKLSLFVYVGGNYLSAKKMIEYFSERGILPDTRIFASEEVIFRVASELCGTCGGASVLCGFLYESGDTAESIAEKIKKIARVYPIGSLIAGGSVTNSPTFAARHNILKRGIEMALK
ncbi:MAG: hypothetical protein IJV72_01285 [Clostridia bacterium]|nr:hypothetical protein [Clostridia bacterium]